MQRWTIAFVFASWAVGDAAAQHIAPFADLNGTSCAITAPPFVPTPVYILALPAPYPGLIEARFRLTGLPDGIYAPMIAAHPAALVSGDPFGDGCNFYFTTCQTEPVPLYTITLTNQGDPAGTRILRVERHVTPTNPAFQCPLLVVCDPPDFTVVCASGGTASLNAGTGCEVAAMPATWTRIKNLYE